MQDQKRAQIVQDKQTALLVVFATGVLQVRMCLEMVSLLVLSVLQTTFLELTGVLVMLV
jgi:hypothetical protein